MHLAQFYLKGEQLIEKFITGKPPRIPVVSDAAIWFFVHCEFKDDVALNHEFHKPLNARLVTVNEFLIGILHFALGVTRFSFHENSALVFLKESLLKPGKGPVPQRDRVFPKINFALRAQDIQQQPNVVWCCSDLRVAGVKSRFAQLARTAHFCFQLAMRYKIESIYTYGWDDAGWTEETDGVTKPMRFETVSHAQAELEEFFANVKAAATAGNMDAEENRNHFRIVAVK